MKAATKPRNAKRIEVDGEDVAYAASSTKVVTVNVTVVPPVVWLDTPQRRAIAEQVLQRSIYSLRQLEKRGLKIHVLPPDDPNDRPNGNRRFIMVDEYLAFLRTVSE